jgi:hypothetical protein
VPTGKAVSAVVEILTRPYQLTALRLGFGNVLFGCWAVPVHINMDYCIFTSGVPVAP